MRILTMLQRIQFAVKNHMQMDKTPIKHLAKMDQAIARISQAQGICLLRTDYLEDV